MSGECVLSRRSVMSWPHLPHTDMLALSQLPTPAAWEERMHRLCAQWLLSCARAVYEVELCPWSTTVHSPASSHTSRSGRDGCGSHGLESRESQAFKFQSILISGILNSDLYRLLFSQASLMFIDYPECYKSTSRGCY